MKIRMLKGIMLVNALALATALVAGGFFVPNSALAAATVTPASGGTNISIDTTSAPGGSGIYKTLSGPSITETAPGNISVGTHVITLPVGWEFNTGSTVTVVRTVGDIEPESQLAVLTANTLTFEITQASAESSGLAFIISSMKVRPTGTAPSSGNMTYSGAGIDGVSGSTIFGTLSTVPGTVTKLAFTAQPTDTVYGSVITPHPTVVIQDQFGNDSTSGLAANLDVTLTLTTGTGTLVGTATLNIGTGGGNGTVTFSGLKVDEVGLKGLTVSATGLSSAVSGTFNITQKPLTATVSVNGKPYDGTNSAVITGVQLNELEVGDVVTVDNQGTAIFDNVNVIEGNNAVSVTGVTITDADALNYNFNGTATGEANITPKPITVTPTAGQTKVYGNADPTFLYISDPLIGGDGFTGALSRVAGDDVGTYAYALGTLSAGGNYALTLAPETFAITQKLLTVTAAGVSREYDQTTNATVTLSSANEETGDGLVYAYTSASFLDKTAANGKTVNVSGISISGAKAGNYNLQDTIAVATANITKKLTAATLNLNNKTYDGDTTAAYSPGTHVVLSDIISGDVVTPSDGTSKSFSDKHVSVGKTVTAIGITLSGADAENYEFNGTGTGTATISARPITVTAVTDTRTYNGTDVSTVIPAITFGALQGTDTAGFTQTFDNKNVGTGKILTPSGSVNDGNSGANYTVTLTTVSTGEITKKSINVTAQTDTKVYDGTFTSSIAPVVDALETGDSVSTAPTQSYVTKDVAIGKTLTPSGLVINDSNSGLNYNINYVNNTAGVINAKGLTVTGAITNSKIYNGNMTATVNFGGASLVGIVETEDVTLNSAGYSATYVDKNVATGKQVTVSGLVLAGADAGNYSLTQPVLNDGVITERTLVVTANGTTKVYDSTLDATGIVTLSDDRVPGDVLTLTHTAAFADKNVGTVKPVSVTGITITGGTDAGNYTLNDVTTAATTANITQAPLTATVIVQDKVFDGNNSATITGVTLNGVFLTDIVTVDNRGTATFENASEGNGKIVTSTGVTITGDDAGNYNFSGTATGTGNILPIPTAVFVDDNFFEGNAGVHTFGYDAFATIQEGIDAVAEDGTVTIEAGTYAENVTIDTKSGITIQGVGETTILEPATGIGFAVMDSDTITIRNLKIHTTGEGAHGIWIAGTPNGGGAMSGLTVQDTTIIVDGYSTGIYAEQVSPAHTGWLIGGSGHGNTITINSGTGVTGDGLDLHDVSGSAVSYNTITLNTPTNSTNVLWTSELSDLTNLVFNSNTVSGSSGSEIAFVPNFILGGSTTITTVTVSGNTFSNWGSRALRIGAGVSSVTVSSNKFTVGTVVQILNNQGTGSVNAEGNWWGYSTGPATDAVVGTVDYRPWYTNMELTGLDSTSPTPVITSSAGTLTNVSPIPVSIDFGEAVTGFIEGDVSVGNGSVSGFTGSGATYTFNVTPTIDGAVTVNIAANAAEDASGNFSNASTQFSITYDSTAPTATITGEPTSLTNVTSTDITVGGTDVVTYQYNLDGGTYSADTPVETHITLSGLAEGAHTLYVRGSDAAGNLQAEPDTANATWTVDSTTPVAPVITSIAGDEFINDSEKTAIVVVGTAEIGSTVDVFLTGGATVTGSGVADGSGDYSITIDGTTLSDGTITPSVTATDAAGNVSEAVTTPTATKDISAPSVTGKTPDASAVGVDPTTNITVVFNEDVVITNTQVTLQKGSDTPVSTAVSGTETVTIDPATTLNNNSTYTVTLTGVTDTAGNALPTTSWTFTTSGSYSVALTNGWNLISLPVIPDSTAIADVLGDDASNIESVWTYNGATGEWLVYHPSEPEAGNLQTMTAGYGYWINYTGSGAGTLSGPGNLLRAGNNTPPSRTLYAGWNLIGYYQKENTDSVEAQYALANALQGYWSILAKYNGSSFVYLDSGDDLNPDEGYWIFLSGVGGTQYNYTIGDNAP